MSLTIAIDIKKRLQQAFETKADFVSISINHEGLNFFMYKLDNEDVQKVKAFIETYMAENHSEIPYKIINFASIKGAAPPV